MPDKASPSSSSSSSGDKYKVYAFTLLSVPDDSSASWLQQNTTTTLSTIPLFVSSPQHKHNSGEGGEVSSARSQQRASSRWLRAFMNVRREGFSAGAAVTILTSSVRTDGASGSSSLSVSAVVTHLRLCPLGKGARPLFRIWLLKQTLKSPLGEGSRSAARHSP